MIHYAELDILYLWDDSDIPGEEGGIHEPTQGWGLRNELFPVILECNQVHLRCQTNSLRSIGCPILPGG